MTSFRQRSVSTGRRTLVLVTVGVLVRATDSGVACPQWPGCFEGRFLPSLSDGHPVWLEWTHRTLAVIVGLEIVALAIVAFLVARDRPSILLSSIGGMALVGFQAWLGRETVRLGNTGASVTAHLATAMALVGLLVFLLVRSSYPARISGPSARHSLTLIAAFGAVATFVLLLFGSNVTATDAALVFPDWPLMNGTLQPIGPDTSPQVASLYATHALHRYVAAAVLVILAAVAWAAQRDRLRNSGL